jgi:hypothetical protein
MGIGHAGDRLSAQATASHDDNTGTVVADVAAGEDEHGIWFSGAMRPDLTEEQVRQFKAATLSGDWRTIADDYELVAALAVNVPGFPIPRVSIAASGARWPVGAGLRPPGRGGAGPAPQGARGEAQVPGSAACRAGQEALRRSDGMCLQEP